MTLWCENVDRLSSLPEDVLSVILSLMPINSAVRTSSLSKRWRYTWTLIHNLDFDDIQSYSHMDRVLMLCKTTRVQTFRSHFSKIDVPNSSVTKWISEAVRLNVSELDIQMTSNIRLPLSFFTCNTLSKLSLKIIGNNYNEFSLRCPPSMYLSNLKTLDINIYLISWDNVFKLIHGCPLLEDLSLEIRVSDNKMEYYFKVPTLRRLRLALFSVFCYGYSPKYIHKVVLNVPNLEYLCVGECLCSLFIMEDLSSLVKAKVSYHVLYAHLWVELLKGISKVRHLTLDISSTKGDAFTHFPEFPDVKKLDIVGCNPFSLPKTPQILKRFCQLDHLCIKKEHDESWWSIEESFPPLTLRNIVSVKYTDTTQQGEFDTRFLRFILENAVDLKKLIVRYNRCKIVNVSKGFEELSNSISSL